MVVGKVCYSYLGEVALLCLDRHGYKPVSYFKSYNVHTPSKGRNELRATCFITEMSVRCRSLYGAMKAPDGFYGIYTN